MRGPVPGCPVGGGVVISAQPIDAAAGRVDYYLRRQAGCDDTLGYYLTGDEPPWD